MTDWVEIIKKAKTSLIELESSISAWIIITTFLYRLPSSYNSFIKIILNSRSKNAQGKMLEPDFNEVCEKILDRERRQKVLTTNSNNFKALKAAANTANINKNDNNSDSKSKIKGHDRGD